MCIHEPYNARIAKLGRLITGHPWILGTHVHVMYSMYNLYTINRLRPVVATLPSGSTSRQDASDHRVYRSL